MATMAEVARRAGVSPATVSHVVNATRPVSESTRQRVLDAIQTTGYVHNRLARSLATSTTRTIGLVISAISNPYFTAVVHALEVELSRAGYTLLLADPHEDHDRELAIVRTLHERRVDGLLMAPVPGSRAGSLAYLAEHRIPTVLVDRVAWDRFDQVASENEQATEQLTAHLAELGHQRIGFVAGLAGLSTTNERRTGYRRGLQHAGRRPDRTLEASGASEAGGARDAVGRLLDSPAPPTALVVANNQMTIGVMQELRARGVRVPQDLALVAFDDFEWADLFSPRLTTMAQAVDAIGVEAVHLLLTRLRQPDIPPRTVRIPPSFVHRESCGCEVRGSGKGLVAPTTRARATDLD